MNALGRGAAQWSDCAIDHKLCTGRREETRRTRAAVTNECLWVPKARAQRASAAASRCCATDERVDLRPLFEKPIEPFVVFEGYLRSGDAP